MDKYNHNDLLSKNRYAKQLRDERGQDGSKKQLVRHMTTKIKTTMIGALDSFEKNFGHLWGQGEEQGELTDEQLDMREVWEEVRTEILDRGNGQIRGAQDEIAQYTLKWNKFSTQFLVKDN